jgi:5-methylcytosine-specific restriction endonuclease McrA
MLEIKQTLRKCAKCMQSVETALFRPRKPNSHLYQSYCIPCEQEYWRNWRTQNKESEIKRSRNFYKNNKSQILIQKKKIREADLDKYIKRSKLHRDKNAEQIKNNAKKWRERNAEKVRAYASLNKAKRRSAKQFVVTANEIIAIKSKPCYECGETKNIHIDHVFPISKGGNHSIGNLMPLCAKCNLSKGSKTYMEWKLWKAKNA